MLTVSRYAQIINTGNKWIVYHSLFGRPIILDRKAFDFFMSFKSKPQKKVTPTQEKAIEDLRSLSLLIDETTDERDHLHDLYAAYQQQVASGSVINYLSLIMSEDCNFSCRYCIARAFRSQRGRTEKTMQSEVAQLAVDKFVALAQLHNQQELYINFGGGEPLLHSEKVSSIIDYCKQSYPNIRFRFAMNTNASLISSNVAEMIRQNGIQIAASLDGPEVWNDKVRRTKRGKGTFQMVLSGFRNLQTAGVGH